MDMGGKIGAGAGRCVETDLTCRSMKWAFFTGDGTNGEEEAEGLAGVEGAGVAKTGPETKDWVGGMPEVGGGSWGWSVICEQW